MIRFVLAVALALFSASALAQPAQRFGPVTTPSLATPNMVQTGPNVADNRATIPAGQTAGAAQNGTWSAASMTIPYNTGADFGNTTPVFAQWFARCTTVSDASRYESCVNVDFYNSSGAAKPWPGSTKSVPAGTWVQVDGGKQYKTTAGGTTGTTQPNWPASGSVQDGSVSWVYQNDGFTNAKSGMSLTSVSTGNGGNHWLVNPNCIINDGYKNQLYCIELDVGNYSGSDWTPTNGLPPVQALWIGGVTTNTGSAAVNVGSQFSTQGKPAWYFGFWCGNALAAGQGCFEDWSNSVAGFHTASFAQKRYDLWLQSSSTSAIYANGIYSGAVIDTQGATAAANHALVVKGGQDVCFDGLDACWRYDQSTQRMMYRRGGVDLMSIDGSGAIRAKGTITGGVTP